MPSWADLDEDETALPIPLSFLADTDILDRAEEHGLPCTSQGIAIAKMLEGTDMVLAVSHSAEISTEDLKHLKSLCYWLRTGFRGV